MKKNTKKTYVEPAEYFPKSVRKELKIGEYAEKKNTSSGTTKKKVKRK